MNVEGRYTDVNQFDNIIVKSANQNGGQIVRVRDIGQVELGAQTYSQSFRLSGEPAAGIAIYQTLDANALDVAKRVKREDGGAVEVLPAGPHL